MTKNQNTSLQKTTSKELSQASQEKMDAMDAKAMELKNLTINAIDRPFSATIAVAAALQSIREIMTDKVIMDGLMLLQGTKLGFVTDKDKDRGYPLEVVRDVTIEAASRGARMIGNEVNIISGACYLTKAYFFRKLDERLGAGKWRLNHHVPKTIFNDKVEIGAEVKTVISWADSGGEHSETVTHQIKGNSYATADAYLGKADRKCGKWLLENITGERFSDGDTDDMITIQAETVPTQVDTTPATGDMLAWIKFLCCRPAIMEEESTIEIFRDVEAGGVTATEANTMHKRLIRLFKAKGILPPTKEDFLKAQKTPVEQQPAEQEPAENEAQQDQEAAFDRSFTMRRLHALGNEVHGKGNWTAERLKLVQNINPEYTSAGDLTDDELREAVLTLVELKQ